MKQAINVIVTKKDVVGTKDILEQMRKSGTFGEVSHPKFGTIGDNILINFSVDDAHVGKVVKVLIKNNVNVLTFKNEELKDIVNQSKKELGQATASQRPLNMQDYQEFQDKKPTLKKPEISIDQLEIFANQGNYKEILSISKDIINYNAQIVERAKQVIVATVNNSIRKLFQEATANKRKADGNIKEILGIVSDPNIRILKDSLVIIKDAGLKIIELYKLHPGYVADLVDLSNNKNMHNLINVKAAIEFGNIVLKDIETHNDAIEYATKYLNTKWLYTAFDVAERELSKEEKDTFERTVTFVNGRRK